MKYALHTLMRTGLLLAGAVLLPFITHAQTYTVGDTVCFTVAAIDAQGDTIRDWDQVGTSCVLDLENAYANSDTSTQSWNNDPDGYTWARVLHDGTPLTALDDTLWELPHTLFVDGKTTLCLVYTKADTALYFTTCSDLRTDGGRYGFVPDTVSRIMVDLTSQHPDKDAVYRMRKYEIVVHPQDRYTNIGVEEIKVIASARYVDEFGFSQPGFSDIFSGILYLSGPTNYFIMSTEAHTMADPQWIAFRKADTDVRGVSDPYEVLDHAPGPFELIEPYDNMVHKHGLPPYTIEFSWTPSHDPYHEISISSTTSEHGYDIVNYEVVIVDSVSLTKEIRYTADNEGRDTSFHISEAELWDAGLTITGDSYSDVSLMWYVEANDGLYTTQNNPYDSTRGLPGRYYMLYSGYPPFAVSPLPHAPSGIALHQNYPNPVAAGSVTNIRFETTAYGPVSLKVYDMLGKEVAVLADEVLAPGVYNADFRAVDLAPGVYHYALTSGGRSTTKSLIITR